MWIDCTTPQSMSRRAIDRPPGHLAAEKSPEICVAASSEEKVAAAHGEVPVAAATWLRPAGLPAKVGREKERWERA
jgi:hypothetical protein